MLNQIESVVLDDWYVVACAQQVTPNNSRSTRLLGQDILVKASAEGDGFDVFAEQDGEMKRSLPVKERYGHIWTTLGQPTKDIFSIPEANEEGRRFVASGAITVKSSALRVVENFLDQAHFPYVHTNFLGSEPNTEVQKCRVELREDGEEIWALDYSFFQPAASAVSREGQLIEYHYRVPTPYNCELFKTCVEKPGAMDVMGLFIQPKDEDSCDAYFYMYAYDSVNSDTGMFQFHQTIFMQDVGILINQVPARLPLDIGAEIPAAKADSMSMAYRRWLKQKGVRFGAQIKAA